MSNRRFSDRLLEFLSYIYCQMVYQGTFTMIATAVVLAIWRKWIWMGVVIAAYVAAFFAIGRTIDYLTSRKNKKL